MAKVTVIIPARGERFLQPTINDLLAKATGDIEIIAVLDGWWPDPPLKNDARVHVLHWGESRGMRPAINAAVALARGKYLMKIDAHCAVSPGYDDVLQKDCADDWVVVPRRYGLNTDTWWIRPDRGPIDMHYLSYPFVMNKDGGGLHGTVWNKRGETQRDQPITDEMSSQGSCWFMSKRHWNRVIGPMDIANYGSFIQEFQEVGGKTWLSGGRVVVNKTVTYAHLYKGKEHGRGYHISKREMSDGARFAAWYWMNDVWPPPAKEGKPGRVHSIRWLIEKFWPVPTWPTTPDGALDWDEVMRATAAYTEKYKAGQDCGF